MSEIDRRVRHIIEGYFGTPVDPGVYAVLRPCELQGGEWLFSQGDPGDSLYFLVRGRLQAWTQGEDAEPRLLGEVVPGDSVGEAGLLTGAPRSAGIQAIRDSLLIRLDKHDFEALAGEHPSMVLKLASHVAGLMQKNLTPSGSAQRGFSTVALLGLHPGLLVQDCMDELTRVLEARCGALALSPSRLAALGAPDRPSVRPTDLPDALKHWLADQENRYPMVVYQCQAEDSPWARFALRQADIVLHLADATREPAAGESERALLSEAAGPAGRQALVLIWPEGEDLSGTDAWLAGRQQLDFHLHLRENHAQDLERLARVVSGRAIGLVLGAGAVRGLAGLGVYRALRELDLPIDWVGGSSIGSIVGAAIAHDWPPRRAIDLLREAFQDSRPFDDPVIPFLSPARGRRMLQALAPLLEARIEDLPLPYFCVSSNLGKGEVLVLERGPLEGAVRASAAFPGVLPPAMVEAELVADGAVLNRLPVDVMRRRPVARVIAVDVSQAPSPRAARTTRRSRWLALRERWLPFVRRYRVPGLADVTLRSSDIGMLIHARPMGAQADLLLQPPVQDFAMNDPSQFDAIVEAGYRHAMQALEDWRAPVTESLDEPLPSRAAAME